MRILVTGGAGFIGSQYVRSLLEGSYEGCRDAHVTVLDKLTYAGNRGNIPAVHPRLDFVLGDICDVRLLLEVVPGHDAVVHFAAESHVDRSIRQSAQFVHTNVAGTQALLDACLRSGVQRFVQVSTDEVYGSIETGSWTEDSPLLPGSVYAASKAGAEMIARAYWHTHGLKVSITRSSNNYGPYQFPEKIIPLFVTNLLEGKPVPLYGDGRNTRQWLHVEDHCRAIQLVLARGRPGEAYNIGGGNEQDNLAVTELLLELCGADRSMIRYVADRKGHDRRYSLDDSKIREELGYAPQVGFDEGLRQTVDWYRDNTDWWKAVKYGN
jgi:dTDP-glucose 4,6-dehydratase